MPPVRTLDNSLITARNLPTQHLRTGMILQAAAMEAHGPDQVQRISRPYFLEEALARLGRLPVVAAYMRFSADDARRAEISIERQQDTIMNWEQAVGLPISVWLSDPSESGQTLNRPAMQELLKLIGSGSRKPKVDIIVATQSDRYSRALADAMDLERRCRTQGILLMTINDGKLDEQAMAFKTIGSSDYVRALSGHLREAKRVGREKGRNPGGRRYGYVPNPGQEGRWCVNADEIREVVTMYKRRRDEWTLVEIQTDLARRRVPSPSGRPHWGLDAILRILRNPFYRGILIGRRSETYRDPEQGGIKTRPLPPHLWGKDTYVPELQQVPDELWHEVQATFTRTGRRGRSGCTAPPLFENKLFCGCCGSPMHFSPNPRYLTYRCGQRAQYGSAACSNTRIARVDEILLTLAETLWSLMDNPHDLAMTLDAYNEERERQTAGVADEIVRLTGGIAELSGKIERSTREMINDPRLDPNILANAIAELRTERDRMRVRLSELKALPGRLGFEPARLEKHRATLEAHLHNLPELLGGADPEFLSSVRSLFTGMWFHPLADRGCYEIELRTDVSRLASVNRDGATGPGPLYSIRTPPARLHGRGRHYGTAAPPISPLLQEFIDGRRDISDAEWDAIAPILALFSRDKNVTPQRHLMNGVICKVLTKLSFDRLPTRYGSVERLKGFVHHKRVQGAWRSVLAALARVNPSLGRSLAWLNQSVEPRGPIPKERLKQRRGKGKTDHKRRQRFERPGGDSAGATNRSISQ